MKKYCLNTRGEKDNKDFSLALEKEGFEVISLPCLEFTDALGSSELEEHIAKIILNNAWLVFTSSNGVKYCLKNTHALALLKDFNKIAVIGKKTKSTLESYGLAESFYPKIQTSEGFYTEFSEKFSETKKPLLNLFRGDKANIFLPASLKNAGFEVVDTVCYLTTAPSYSKKDLTETISRSIENNALIFILSGETGRNLKKYSEEIDKWQELSQLSTAVIGPVTEKEVKELGFNIKLVSKQPDINALAEEASSKF